MIVHWWAAGGGDMQQIGRRLEGIGGLHAACIGNAAFRQHGFHAAVSGAEGIGKAGHLAVEQRFKRRLVAENIRAQRGIVQSDGILMPCQVGSDFVTLIEGRQKILFDE